MQDSTVREVGTTGNPSGRRRVGWVMALVASLSLVAAACVPPDPPGDPHGLRVSLGDGELVLDWHAPRGADPDAYDVERLVDGVGWQPVGTAADTTWAFSDVEDGSVYRFRVRAAAASGRPAGAWSPTVHALYVDLVLPVVRIETEDRRPILDKETDIDGTMEIDPNGSAYEPYSGVIEIRGRGNSTWNQPKKPYRLELDEDSELMGMPIHEDWVLLANAMDRSQLRTWTAAQIAEATDLPYTPRYRHVEVVLNGEYLGVYQLTEDPDKIDPNRIDITEIEEEDTSGEALTGGYLLEIDARLEANGEPGFRTSRGVPIVVKEPDPAEPEQFAYIRSRVQAFEDAMYAANFADPVAGYRSLLDVDSFIDHYIVQEVTRNEDSFWSSTFFTKDRSEDRFRFGPIWDFDLSLGRTITPGEVRPPQGFRTRNRMPWTNRIFGDPALVEAIGQRWAELRPSLEMLPVQMVALGDQLREAIGNDEVRWNYRLQPTDEAQYLADYLTTRIDWFESQYPG